MKLVRFQTELTSFETELVWFQIELTSFETELVWVERELAWFKIELVWVETKLAWVEVKRVGFGMMLGGGMKISYSLLPAGNTCFKNSTARVY